jgi:hypothetical protein
LQAALQLPSGEAAVDIVVGFPALLGLNSATLAAKWRRLQELAGRNTQWQQQLEQLLQQRGAGCLGRVLAAGPGVVDRLQYVLDAQSGHGVQSVQNGAVLSRGSSSSKLRAGIREGGVQGAGATAAAAAAGGRPIGELRLSTVLLQSEAVFTARHPEFVLWRLNQRSRPTSGSSSGGSIVLG